MTVKSQSDRDILDFVVLHKLRFEVAKKVGRNVAESLRLKARIVDDMLLEIEGFVLADRLMQQDIQVTFPFPSSWWQHLKLALMCHLPKWLTQRMNVRKSYYHHTIRLEKYLVYPKSKMELPEDRFGKPVEWVIWRNQEIGVEKANETYTTGVVVREVARKHP